MRACHLPASSPSVRNVKDLCRKLLLLGLSRSSGKDLQGLATPALCNTISYPGSRAWRKAEGQLESEEAAELVKEELLFVWGSSCGGLFVILTALAPMLAWPKPLTDFSPSAPGIEPNLLEEGAMPLHSTHVFASHIGHTGKTTLAFQMSTFYASKHPEARVLIMDLAEEGDLTKRLLGGVDAAGRKVESLFGGVFRLLQAAEKRPSGLTSWLWSSTFDVMEHAVRLKDHNPALPDNIFLISSGAWPRAEAPMSDDVRKEVCERIRDSLEKSTETWKLFCDTDGDRRPSPYTMLAYGLCDEAIVPLHLNKGDLDRTETMLGVMHELRQRGEIRTQVLFIVWNFVKVLKDDPVEYQGMTLPFTPTKVCMDILESCNRRLFGSATELAGLFVHSGESETDFIKNSTAVLRVLADNVLKPSEELGVPVVEMVSRLADSGKKTMKFQSGDIAYDTKGETISNVMDGLKQLEEKFEAMALGCRVRGALAHSSQNAAATCSFGFDGSCSTAPQVMVVLSATLEESVNHGIDLNTNAFLLVHGWTAGPLLLESADKLLPACQSSKTVAELAAETGAKEGPLAIVLRCCSALGYLDFDPVSRLNFVVWRFGEAAAFARDPALCGSNLLCAAMAEKGESTGTKKYSLAARFLLQRGEEELIEVRARDPESGEEFVLTPEVNFVPLSTCTWQGVRLPDSEIGWFYKEKLGLDALRTLVTCGWSARLEASKLTIRWMFGGSSSSVLEAEAGDGDTGEFDDEAEAEQVTLEEQNLAKEIAQAEEEGVDPAFCEALESEKEAAAEGGGGKASSKASVAAASGKHVCFDCWSGDTECKRPGAGLGRPKNKDGGSEALAAATLTVDKALVGALDSACNRTCAGDDWIQGYLKELE
ncbi:hypothetical protein AK812_SmicGene39822 [Symbiodinium microadriaticum]|uniref:Uncharacterized protein n=1 Tax=Symbiodinium microadriaticum TaxID=2951 RepID=A0A1Q9CA86_SYMMI|nr:hypothetical protein AK812_SmicGene39822 [Symbiodinium microadriaticum]